MVTRVTTQLVYVRSCTHFADVKTVCWQIACWDKGGLTYTSLRRQKAPQKKETALEDFWLIKKTSRLPTSPQWPIHPLKSPKKESKKETALGGKLKEDFWLIKKTSRWYKGGHLSPSLEPLNQSSGFLYRYLAAPSPPNQSCMGESNLVTSEKDRKKKREVDGNETAKGSGRGCLTDWLKPQPPDDITPLSPPEPTMNQPINQLVDWLYYDRYLKEKLLYI